MPSTWTPTDPTSTAPRLRIRIELDDAPSPVWRVIDVPGDTTLEVLHVVVQTAMGWENSHLHGFARGDFWRGPPGDRFVSDSEIAEGDPGVPESTVAVADVLTAPGDALAYIYDFGDGWEHTLRLEEISVQGAAAPQERRGSRFRLLDGAGACPPEDCGGVGGFEDLLGAAMARIEDPTSVDAESYDRLRFQCPGLSPQEAVAVLTTFNLGRTVPVVASLGAPAPALPAPLVALVKKCQERTALQELITLAGFTSPELPAWDLPDAETAARIVAPFAWFIRHVSPDGIPLTPAGYLRPVDVQAVATELDLAKEWHGLFNREAQTRPVLEFREAAQALGLVRKVKGRLTVPAKVQRIAEDPLALFQTMARNLPAGRGDAAEDAGWIVLLSLVGTPTAAPDRQADDTTELAATCAEYAQDRLAEAAMSGIGWRVGDQFMTRRDITFAAKLTYTVLQRVGASRGRRRSPGPDAVIMARAALLAQA